MIAKDDKEVVGLKTIIVGYIGHWRLFLGAFILACILGVLYICLYPRTYSIMARIQLQEEENISGSFPGLGGDAAGLMKSFGLGAVGGGTLIIEDELNILKSNTLMRRVAFDLGTNVDYTRPRSFYRMYSTAPYRLSTDSATDRGLLGDIRFKIRVRDGKLEVSTRSDRVGKRSFTFASLPAVINHPEGDFKLEFNNGNAALLDLDIRYKPSGWAAEEMNKKFLIEEYSKNSNFIELSCSDYERSRAIGIINLLVDRYNNEAASFKQKLHARALSYLDARIDSVTVALRNAEILIARYKRENAMTDVEYDVQFYVNQMRDIQTKIIELETQIHLVMLMDEFVKNPANKYSPMPGLMSPEGDKSTSISLYNQALIERARVIQSSSENNPLVGSLTIQADKLRESVFLSIENMQIATRHALADIKEKEAQIFSLMRRIPDQERDYIDLKREQEIIQGIYLILLQKKEETALEEGLNQDRIKIVDSAFVKKKAVAPRKLFAAIGIIIFTMVVPVVWLFVREQTAEVAAEYRRRRRK
ncbi:MAG: tyrosine protein kinase [Tannerellaceae bacterium]|jgi:uncharacterized protein involved in exopolysaccharide biosynthesis|nr:tyrosine protein kinase [Tannerellaceae bacterium]